MKKLSIAVFYIFLFFSCQNENLTEIKDQDLSKNEILVPLDSRHNCNPQTVYMSNYSNAGDYVLAIQDELFEQLGCQIKGCPANSPDSPSGTFYSSTTHFELNYALDIIGKFCSSTNYAVCINDDFSSTGILINPPQVTGQTFQDQIDALLAIIDTNTTNAEYGDCPNGGGIRCYKGFLGFQVVDPGVQCICGGTENSFPCQPDGSIPDEAHIYNTEWNLILRFGCCCKHDY